MSGNTKATLAIVFGVVGILLGILGTITAYNAKDAVDSDAQTTAQVQALVEEKFKEAQTRQDSIEASQRSEAEKFVAQLTKGENNLLKKINGNHQSIKKLKRQVRNLNQQVKTLKNRDNELSSELTQVENEQASEFQQLNQRINKTNNQVQQLQRQVSNLRGLIGG